MLPFRPMVVWNGQSLFLQYPVKVWYPTSMGIGGSDDAASGIRVAYEIRRDRGMDVTLLVTEGEWPYVRQWLEWACGTGGAFTFQLDMNDLSTLYTCYLTKPRQGDVLKPNRYTAKGVYTIDISLRTTTSAAIDTVAYPNAPGNNAGLFWRYKAGMDPRTLGVTFTGDGNRTYYDANGTLQKVAVNVPRYAAYVTDRFGVRHLVWLLEGTSTNITHATYNFGTNGTNGWSLSGDPAGVLSVVDDSAELAAAGLSQIVTDGKVLKIDNTAGTTAVGAQSAGGNTTLNPHTISAYIRGGTGNLDWANYGPSKTQFGALANYTRIVNRAFTPTATTGVLRVYADPGQVVYFVLAQMEESKFETSVIPNSTFGPLTRATEIAYLPWLFGVRDMTVYGKNVDLGLAAVGGNSFLWSIGDGQPRFFCYGTGPYQVDYQNGINGGDVHSTPGIAVVNGDVVETRAVFEADGSVLGGASLNGAVERVGARSAILAPPAAWNLNHMVIGSAFQASGAAPGFVGLESLIVSPGVHDIGYMRSL